MQLHVELPQYPFFQTTDRVLELQLRRAVRQQTGTELWGGLKVHAAYAASPVPNHSAPVSIAGAIDSTHSGVAQSLVDSAKRLEGGVVCRASGVHSPRSHFAQRQSTRTVQCSTREEDVGDVRLHVGCTLTAAWAEDLMDQTIHSQRRNCLCWPRWRLDCRAPEPHGQTCCPNDYPPGTRATGLAEGVQCGL